ncbi:MAG: hypothetical protein QME81_05665 [bacterium]|nr:hypothetical protein [bacterium]
MKKITVAVHGLKLEIRNWGDVNRFGQLDLQPYLPESLKLLGRCATGPNNGQGRVHQQHKGLKARDGL